MTAPTTPKAQQHPKGKRAKGEGGSSYEQPTPEKIAYGNRLRTAREIAGMNLTEAAEALGYSQPVQLSLMETGHRMPTLRIIVECAKLFGTTADFLCGLSTDSDRDPAVAVQRHIASRVAADVQGLIRSMSSASVNVVRELMPSSADGQRLACLVVEANIAMAVFRQRNPGFDGMRAGATLAAKLEMATAAAATYRAQVERGKRLMSIRSLTVAPETPESRQFSLLPILDVSTAG